MTAAKPGAAPSAKPASAASGPLPPLAAPAVKPPAILTLANASAAPLAQLPRHDPAAFRELLGRGQGRRVSALFARRLGASLEAVAVIAADGDGVLELARAELGESFPSMTPALPEVHLFEREIWEQWGAVPIGHPWQKPVRFQPPALDGGGERPSIGVTEFYRIEGDEVHEVAVGPVHAGVIEPGHFRFQCHGETVMHLEISLGYQHRGVERALVGGPNPRAIHYAETVAGDTTIGHAIAYCEVLEALAGIRPPPRAMALRAIALELERLANHVGDLGALANDIGFLPTAAYCGRLRGDYLNLTAELCGSRFGRGMVRPGGVGFDVGRARVNDMVARLERAARDTRTAVELLWDTASVQARFEDTGRVSTEVARQLGLVGPAARASGVKRDVRKTHPSGYYRFVHLPVSVWNTGDVFGRAFVRWLEIQRSAEFVLAHLRRLPAGATTTELPALRGAHIAVSLVEGWRGEICHVALTDELGRFSSYKIVDPSFHNWTGLAMALRDQQISDFPLCNKSFNLSYCGHDL
jgi:Ni,Fe-hydrogenase III large subunit